MSRPVLRTTLCDLLDIEYPLLLAGMGGVVSPSGPELVAAVSNVDTDQVAFDMKFVERQIEVILDLRPAVYVAGLGDPRFMVERAHGLGISPGAAGQGVGLVRAVRPAAEVFRGFVEEACDVLDRGLAERVSWGGGRASEPQSPG